MLYEILKFICYGFMAFLAVVGILVFGQFFTNIENVLIILVCIVGFILIRWAIKYRQKHPYKPIMNKESWIVVFWVCLYKILTGKKD